MNSKEKILDSERPIHEILVDFEMFLSGRLKPSSVNVYMVAIKKFIQDGKKIDSPQDYIDFIIEHMIKKKSSHYYDIIIKFVNWLNLERENKKLILFTIKAMRKKYHDPIKQTLILSKEQRMDIINNLSSYKHRIIGLIQEECGVRAGDVLKLKRGFIDYDVEDNKVIMKIMFQQKGDKVRTVFIFDQIAKKRIQEFIREKYLHKNYYFLEDKYERYDFDFNKLVKSNYDWYHQDLTQTCKRLGYDPHKFTTHDIRRNFAVETLPLVNNNVAELQKAMGHKDINTTIRYLRHSGLETKDIFKKRYNSNL